MLSTISEPEGKSECDILSLKRHWDCAYMEIHKRRKNCLMVFQVQNHCFRMTRWTWWTWWTWWHKHYFGPRKGYFAWSWLGRHSVLTWFHQKWCQEHFTPLALWQTTINGLSIIPYPIYIYIGVKFSKWLFLQFWLQKHLLNWKKL